MSSEVEEMDLDDDNVAEGVEGGAEEGGEVVNNLDDVEEGGSEIGIDIVPMEIEDDEVVETAEDVFTRLIKLKDAKTLDKNAWLEVYRILKKGDSQFSINRGGPLFDSKKYTDKPHIIDELNNFITKYEERQKYLSALSISTPRGINDDNRDIGGVKPSSPERNGSDDENQYDEKHMMFRLDVDHNIPKPSSKTEHEFYAFLLKKIKKCGNNSVIHFKLKAATSYNPVGTGTFSLPIQDDELEEEEDVNKDEVNNQSDESESSLEDYTDDVDEVGDDEDGEDGEDPEIEEVEDSEEEASEPDIEGDD